MKEHERAQNMVGLLDFYHWPTNGSRVIINGHRVQMPFTGIIWIKAYDTNYSNREFRQDSEGLAAALRLAFTNRSVDLFMPGEIKP